MKGGGGQQQQPDQAMDIFLLFGFVVVLVIVLWYNFHEHIVAGIFAFKRAEGYLLLKLLTFIDDLSHLVNTDMMAVAHLKSAIRYMETAPPADVTYKDLFAVSNVFGEAFTLPSVIVGGCGVIYALFFHRFSKFKQVYTMATLSRQEVVNWPQISCVIGKNLIKENILEGEWRISEQPLGFAKSNGLLKTETVKGITVARLNKDLAKSVFSAQMGPLWTGLEGLPPYVLALFAIFCARGEGDAKSARALIRQIAKSAGSGRLDFGGTRELLHKHVRSPKVGRAVGPHAYLYTVMASMLELGRQEGVLSVSEFIWLKPLDRGLWYMLSNVGRQTTFVEIAAPFSHWMVEKRLRRPLKVPMVDEAIDALDEALSQIIVNEDEI